VTRDEAKKIIERENLNGFNIEGHSIDSNQVGVFFEETKWFVYHSDEKANFKIIGVHQLEEEALDHVIECLRLNNHFEERRRRKREN